MLPLAPTLFSMTTGCPRRAASRSEIARTELSAKPPAEKGTTMRTGLAGQSCARASAVDASRSMKRIFFMKLLSRVPAIVDVQRSPVHVLGASTSKPENRRRDLLGRADASRIDRFHDPVLARLRQLVVHGGLRRPRGHRVDDYAVRPELLRPGLGQVEDACLADAVPEVRMARERRHRADVDDATGFSGLHLRSKRGDQGGGGFDIHSQDLALVFFGNRIVGIAEQDACVI